MSINTLKIAIIGGDMRQKKLASMLSDKGYKVMTYGLYECDTDLEDVLHDAKIIVGAIPFIKNNNMINMQYTDEVLTVEELLQTAKQCEVLMAGLLPIKVKKNIEKYKIKVIDLYKEEEIAIKNAVPTAEGAIQIAMQESDITIQDSKSLVLGYGKCGKIIADKLKALNSDVTVATKHETDIADIVAHGHKPIKVEQYSKVIEKMDFIFNTIPAKVMNEKELTLLNKNTVVIDIAMAPGGIDYEKANELKARAFFCPGLPGKVAPTSAAKIVFETVENILRKEGLI